jgi:hypothetical protein
MAGAFKNSVIKDVGPDPVSALSTGPNSRLTVIGMSFSNLTQSFVYVSVLLRDDASVTGFYLKDILVPANTTLKALNGGEKLIIAPSNELFVSSSAENSVDAVISFVEIN